MYQMQQSPFLRLGQYVPIVTKPDSAANILPWPLQVSTRFVYGRNECPTVPSRHQVGTGHQKLAEQIDEGPIGSPRRKKRRQQSASTKQVFHPIGYPVVGP